MSGVRSSPGKGRNGCLSRTSAAAMKRCARGRTGSGRCLESRSWLGGAGQSQGVEPGCAPGKVRGPPRPLRHRDQGRGPLRPFASLCSSPARGGFGEGAGSWRLRSGSRMGPARGLAPRRHADHDRLARNRPASLAPVSVATVRVRTGPRPRRACPRVRRRASRGRFAAALRPWRGPTELGCAP